MLRCPQEKLNEVGRNSDTILLYVKTMIKISNYHIITNQPSHATPTYSAHIEYVAGVVINIFAMLQKLGTDLCDYFSLATDKPFIYDP